MEDNIRIVVIGKTGTGKSALSNTILERRKYQDCMFPKRFGRDVHIIDTPGVFDTERTNEDVANEIKRATNALKPGPHAIILTVRVGRLSQEDSEVFQIFTGMFGESMFKYGIVAFTHSDHWKETDGKPKGKAIQDFIKTLPENVSNFLKRINNRYIEFDTDVSDVSKTENEIQALMFEIDRMVKENGNSFYTNEQEIDSATIQTKKQKLETNENRRQSGKTNGKEPKPKNRRQTKSKNTRQAKQKKSRQVSKTRRYLLNEFRRTRFNADKVINASMVHHSNRMSFCRI